MLFSAFEPGLVVYQIYPRSFNDANNDGIGDLRGIIHKLGYLADLGVDALWLCPIYPSPMVDFGYDISNYRDIDPIFGTMADFDELLRSAHERGIRVIMDLVFNHTSNQHPWFARSVASEDDYASYYIWADGRDGGPPNNWQSCFGGSAWTFQAERGQYYLHSFATAQPDLNWRNPRVRAELRAVMRFWLDRGVDGFRMDAVMWFAKDAQLRDDPPMSRPGMEATGYDGLAHTYSRGRNEVYTYLRQLANVVKPYATRILLLEVQFDTWLDVRSYHDFYRRIDSLRVAPFNFIELELPFEATRMGRFLDDFEAGLRTNDVPVYITGNHDRSRLASRIGTTGAAACAVLFSMLPGVFVLYYGDELGMTDARNVPALDIYEKNLPGRGLGRDPERTPMQWTAGRYAGFSDHAPWLAVGDSYRHVNVASEQKDASSLLALYKKLLALRHNVETLRVGEYVRMRLRDKRLMGYARELGGERIVVIVNFSHTESVPCPVRGELLVSSMEPAGVPGLLHPLEGRVYRVS